jgi:predicted glycosyltransferase
MKIWFDLSNSPHINLFAELIRDLERSHEVIITCRPLANTIDLLELQGFRFHVIGKHYGKKFLSKLTGYPVRVAQLYSFLRDKGVDVAVSQSSFHSPITARLLNIPSLYMNDNEHAMGNIPSFICANIIMVPEFLDRKTVHRQLGRDRKIIQYPGVKEGIYLWNLQNLGRGEQNGDTTGKPQRETIYVRPEPWAAQYYKGDLNFMDTLLRGLAPHARVVLLPRGEVQAKHYQQTEFSDIEVLEKPASLPDIAASCSLFIGAGGTMTRELAVLGVPTISVYRSDVLQVDSYLVGLGQMVHKPDLTPEFALEYMRSEGGRGEPRQELLDKGKQAYELIKETILSMQGS